MEHLLLLEGVKEGLHEEWAAEKEREDGKLEHIDEGRELRAIRPEEDQSQWQRALCAKLRGLNLFPTVMVT